MAKRTTAINEDRKSKSHRYDYKSLEDFLEAERKGEEKAQKILAKAKKTASQKLINENLQQQIDSLKRLSRIEKQLNSQNIEMTDAQRKKYAILQAQKEKADKNQEVLDYWKLYSKKSIEERKEAEKEQKKQLETYKKVFELRSHADEDEQKIQENNKTLQSLQQKLEEAKKNNDTKSAQNIKANMKAISSENARLSQYAEQANSMADSVERSADSKEGFAKVFKEAFAEVKNENTGEVWGKDLLNAMKGIGKAITDSLNAINTAIDDYADYQTGINARLQGSRTDDNGNSIVNVFSSLEDTLSSVSYSPLIKTQELYENLSALVDEGISENVEQRAFLQTIKDGIATTFDANNSALKRIIRLQQQDSTAARLGMEAYLTSYLNELTNNTEYLQSTFDSVAESLLEASSLMNAQQSTEFEYVVQKWLGTLTGLGLSESTATNISSAIGYLGSGNVSALSSSDMQNLLVMATTRAGLDYSDILSTGLNADKTNQILYSLVTYLAELGSNSSNVVKSQLASTFGVDVSDLVAASNIVGSSSTNETITNLYNNLLTYNNMYEELQDQVNKLSEREGISNILENLFSNFTYSTGMSIASNPASFATWKITDLIQGVTGGINIPYITAMGNGIDLETTVENLMKLGIVGAATLGGIGDIISGVSSVGNGSSLLDDLEITSKSGNTRFVLGEGINTRASGVGTSLSTLVGNINGEDYYSSTLNTAYDEQQSALDQKVEESEDSTTKLLSYEQGEKRSMLENMETNIDSLRSMISSGITVNVSSEDISKFS